MLFRMGSLAQNAFLLTGGQFARVVGQAVWVIILARTIGPQTYGTFAGAAGLASAIGSLTGFGFGVLMMQDASRDPTAFTPAWKRAHTVVVLSGFLLCAAYVFVASRILGLDGNGLLFYAAIGVPEIVSIPLTIIAAYAFQSHERMGVAALINLFPPAANLLALALFFAFATPEHGLGSYLPFHAATSLLGAVGGIVMVHVLLRPSTARLGFRLRDLKEAFGFSLMRLADTAMTSMDKTLVLLLAGGETAGVYASSYRVVAVLAMPATSLGAAALPRLFRAHVEGERAHVKIVGKLIRATALYGILAAMAAWGLSQWMPLLFGPRFDSAAQMTRGLCLFPLLYGLYTLGGNVLVTSERRALRLTAQGAGLLLLAIAAYTCMPRFGQAGAAAMLLSATSISAVLVWIAFAITSRAGFRRSHGVQRRGAG